MNIIPRQCLIGIEYFRLPDLESLWGDKYFDCMDELRPLFKKVVFQKTTPGFYLNLITNRIEDEDDDKNSLRLTYFTTDVVKTFKSMDDFVKENNDKIKIYHSDKTTSRPIGQDLSEFNEERLRFWQFLSNNCQIGLDLLKNYGRTPSQRLVWEYRTHYLLNRIRPKSIFELILNKYSPYFNELKQNNLDEQFWQDLVNYFSASKDFGLHFLVNMTGFNDPSYDERIFREDWFLNKQ